MALSCGTRGLERKHQTFVSQHCFSFHFFLLMLHVYATLPKSMDIFVLPPKRQTDPSQDPFITRYILLILRVWNSEGMTADRKSKPQRPKQPRIQQHAYQPLLGLAYNHPHFNPLKTHHHTQYSNPQPIRATSPSETPHSSIPPSQGNH